MRNPAHVSITEYRVLRCGGLPAARASLELHFSPGFAQSIETSFKRNVFVGKGWPRFARHSQHVAAVTCAGGYPGASHA